MKNKKGRIKNILMIIVCILTIVINAIAPWGREALDGFYGTYAVKTDKDKMNEYLEKGEKVARLDTVWRIADALEITPSELIRFIESEYRKRK